MAAAPPLAGAGSVVAVAVALVLSLLVLLLPAASQGGGGGGSMAGYVPVSTVVYRQSAVSHEPFSQCSQCRCCPAAGDNGSSSSSSSCVQTRCCYGINCNIPGKPFGFCAFTPRSCGCGGAAGNCTAAPATPRAPPTSY